MGENVMNELTVSVYMITYNHEKYIRRAIEGVLMQQTTFPVKLFIGEDCSTDHTRQICLQYKSKYPFRIELLLPEKNIGGRQNMINVLNACQGKYVALCDGDDYWTDPLKLQKQVDFLEAHPEYVYSCHRFDVFEEKTGKRYLSHNRYFEAHPAATLFSFSRKYALATEWITQTLTSVIRRDAIDVDYNKHFEYYRDLHLVYNVLSKGKGVCHSFSGAVRCENSGGIYAHLSKDKQLEINYKLFKELYLYDKSRLPKVLFRDIYVHRYLHKGSSSAEKLSPGLFKCEVFTYIFIYRLKQIIKQMIR